MKRQVMWYRRRSRMFHRNNCTHTTGLLWISSSMMTMISRKFFSTTWKTESMHQPIHQPLQMDKELLITYFSILIKISTWSIMTIKRLRLSCDTHLDEAREESGFLNPISNMEKLQHGEQLAQTHHKANRVECVCYGICKVKNHI